jgi:hypothetical protein
MTLLGVFFNLADRRTALMVQIEAYLDDVLVGDSAAAERPPAAGRGIGAAASGALAHTVEDFGKSVARLEGAVVEFDAALQRFASSTRDFREFNLHLKDNVQRMSLTFGDLSETLKTHIGALKSGARS